MRETLTTTTNKAKCLRYRNGRRCGRVAKYLCRWVDRIGNQQMPLCETCHGMVLAIGGELIEHCPSGYTVRSGLFDGSRNYSPIGDRELPCADCGKLVPVNESRGRIWCLDCYTAQLGGTTD